MQSLATTSVKVHGFDTQLPLKRPHDKWFTRIKGADPRSKWILLEQTAHAGTMPCTDACTLHTRSCACSSRICRQASRLWQSGYAARRNCGFDHCYYHCHCYYCCYYYYCITPLAGVETTRHCLIAVCVLLVKSLFAACCLLLACLLACLFACCLLARLWIVCYLLACLLASWLVCLH